MAVDEHSAAKIDRTEAQHAALVGGHGVVLPRVVPIAMLEVARRVLEATEELERVRVLVVWVLRQAADPPFVHLAEWRGVDVLGRRKPSAIDAALDATACAHLEPRLTAAARVDTAAAAAIAQIGEVRGSWRRPRSHRIALPRLAAHRDCRQELALGRDRHTPPGGAADHHVRTTAGGHARDVDAPREVGDVDAVFGEQLHLASEPTHLSAERAGEEGRGGMR